MDYTIDWFHNILVNVFIVTEMNYYNICCLLIFLFDWGGDRVYSQAHEQETREENDGTGVADHYTNEVFMKLTEPKVYNKLVPPDGQS